jgi:hypothetical protein
LGTEHAFKFRLAYFKALKASKAGASVDSVGSPDSWEDVEPPTLASLTWANDTFKTPKKLKLGAMLSPVHVPFMPQSCRPALIKIEILKEPVQEEEHSLHIQYGIQAMMADWNKLNASFELICHELKAVSRSKTGTATPSCPQ